MTCQLSAWKDNHSALRCLMNDLVMGVPRFHCFTMCGGLSKSCKRLYLGESEDIQIIFLSGSEQIMGNIGYYCTIEAFRQKIMLTDS